MTETQMQKTGNGSTALVTVKDKNSNLKKALTDRTDQIAKLCAGTGMRPERLIQSALLACVRNPDLLDCTPASVVIGVHEAASLGLMLDGVMGQAYLIPRNVKNRSTGNMEKRAVMMPGYRGLISLARKSGEISSIESHVVYQGDVFHYTHGLHADLAHTPRDERPDDAKRTHVWALAKFKDGGHHFEVLTARDVESIKTRSQVRDGYGPWATDTDEMWKKTVLRRLCKMLPMTTTSALAAERLSISDGDDPPPLLDGFVDPETGLVTEEAPTSGLDRLAHG